MVEQCTLWKPLLMVIPYPGVWIPCPVHGRHWVSAGPKITWSVSSAVEQWSYTPRAGSSILSLTTTF